MSHAGEETFNTINRVLSDMLMLGSLTEEIVVPDAVETEPLPVRWHLCADHKLMALVAGMAGAGSNQPCFLCKWDRSVPYIWQPSSTHSRADRAAVGVGRGAVCTYP